MVADQLPMNFNRFFCVSTLLPKVFAQTGLNAELTFDQVLPGSPFFAEMLVDSQIDIGISESVGAKLTSIV